MLPIVYSMIFIIFFFSVDRARQSFRQSFRMTSMRRSGRRGHPSASQASSPGMPSSSSPTIDDSPRSSTYSQDHEANRVGGRLRSPKEDEEDPFE